MAKKYLPTDFYKYPWTQFFEEYDEEAFNKAMPPDMDLVLDENGFIAQTDGITGVAMRLAKCLLYPKEAVYHLIKSQYVDSIIKRHQLRNWLQKALETVRFGHKEKEDLCQEEMKVPAILLAALIQSRLELEAEVAVLNQKIAGVQEAFDEVNANKYSEIKVAALDPKDEAALKRLADREGDFCGRVEIRKEAPVRTLHIDPSESGRVVMDAVRKAEKDSGVTVEEFLQGVNTLRTLSNKPNLCGCTVQHMKHVGSESGRTTSDKPNVEEVESECNCVDNGCKTTPCKGECGCKRCRRDYMDFLSCE